MLCEYQLHFSSTAQRCALPAGGRDEMTLLWRNRLQPETCLKNAATPTRRVHAVLGAHEEDMRRRNSGSRIAFASSFFAPRNATNRANP